MRFCYIARMDERRSWLRRARRILSISLLTCIICNLDQKVMQVPRFNHICYSSRGYNNQVGPTWCRVTEFESNQSWPSRAVPFLPLLLFLPHRHLPILFLQPELPTMECRAISAPTLPTGTIYHAFWFSLNSTPFCPCCRPSEEGGGVCYPKADPKKGV
jgi:hypothetical protein